MTTAYTALTYRCTVKTDAARIIKLGTEMSYSDSRKSIYFEIKRSKVKVTRHKNIACVGYGSLVQSAGILWFACGTGLFVFKRRHAN